MALFEYYFDASDDAVSDPNNVWQYDERVADEDISNYARTQTAGSVSSNYLFMGGTEALTGEINIENVQARICGYSSNDDVLNCAVYSDNLEELLGTATLANIDGLGDFITLTPPSGGWTWDKIAALECKAYGVNVSFPAVVDIY